MVAAAAPCCGRCYLGLLNIDGVFEARCIEERNDDDDDDIVSTYGCIAMLVHGGKPVATTLACWTAVRVLWLQQQVCSLCDLDSTVLHIDSSSKLTLCTQLTSKQQ